MGELAHSRIRICKRSIFAILILASSAWAQERQPASTAKYETGESEAQSYKQWFDAWVQKDYLGTVDRAITYLQEYPDGRYADYLRKYLGQMSGTSVGKRNFFLDALVFALMDSGANLTGTIKDGKTYLMLAAMDGSPDVMTRLIDKGAELGAQEDSYGRTALTYAIWLGNAQAVQVLLNRGADAQLKDKSGRSSSDNATATRNPKIIERLQGYSAKD